ncbi:MAG: tetratricopeptide repeat protein [Acidobacteriota bacterium]
MSEIPDWSALRERLGEVSPHKRVLVPFGILLFSCLAGSTLRSPALRAFLAMVMLAVAIGFAFVLGKVARAFLFATAATGYILAFGQVKDSMFFSFMSMVASYGVPPLVVHLMMMFSETRPRVIATLRALHLYIPMAVTYAAGFSVLLMEQRQGLALTGFTTPLVPLIYWGYYAVLMFFVTLGFLSGMPAPRPAPRQSTDAGDLEREGKFGIASRVYARSQQFDKSAEAAQRGGDWLHAAEMYRQAGDSFNAGEMYYRAQKWDDAIAMYERAKAYGAAARVLLQVGRHEEAARLYEKAGDAAQAVRVLEEAEKKPGPDLYLAARQYDKAAAAYAERGDWIRAAEITEMQLRKMEDAASLYVRAGSFGKAGELYEAAGKKADAVEAYLKSPVTAARAARMALEAGDVDRAAGILENLAAAQNAECDDEDALMMLARIHVERQKTDDAIRILQRLKRFPEPGASVFFLLGRCLLAKGLPEMAVEELRTAVEMQLAPAEALEAQYDLACALEATNQPAEATQIYHAIMAKDLYFKDVEQRYRRLKRGPS